MKRLLPLLFMLFSAGGIFAAENVLIVADKADEMPKLRKLLSTDGRKVDQVGQKQLDVKTLKNYDAVAVYIHEVILEPVETALIDYTQNGGRLVVVHHALASAKMKNPRWLKFLGVALYPRNDPQAPWLVSAEATFDLINLAPKHFITSNKIEYPKKVAYRSERGNISGSEFPAFTMTDTEIFHNQRQTDLSDKTLLLAYRLEGERAEKLPKNVPAFEESAGWLKPSGKGWIVYLQQGHSSKDFGHPIFSRILLNALDWKPKEAVPLSEIAPLKLRP